MGIGSDLIDEAWALYGDQLVKGDVEMVRIFFAHARDSQDVGTKCLELSRMIADKYVAAGKNRPVVRAVPGRDDYERYFRGDWEAWQESVVARLDSITRKPAYALFVVDQESCGRATANIIKAALTQGKAVFLWSQDPARLQSVDRVTVRDPEDWANGFHIEIESDK